MEVFFAFMWVGIGFLFFYMIKRTKAKTSADGVITCQGAVIDPNNRTVTIKNKTYTAEEIRGVRWATGLGPHGNIGEVFLELNDMDKPYHKFAFTSQKDTLQFSSRLSIIFGLS